MTRLLTIFCITLPLAQAVGTTVYTGFNHGAFWGSVGNAKKAADFKADFGHAQNLSTTVPFNSARLLTCKQQGTNDDPTEAFDAAVETKTNILLGMWLSPAKRDDPLDAIINTELSALGKGFDKHGQALADLVIGLSVGSEDIYRWEDAKAEVGVAATDITAAIKTVKDNIASSAFANYMTGKPVGHVDTAEFAVVDGADFYGITIYPYWNKDPIVNAKNSFAATLEDVKRRAQNTPIWIAEMGWPYQGVSQGAAEANAENLQQFWKDVGCSVVGEYTTFWFELIKDSEDNQPDWGMIDPNTHQARIDLSCITMSQPSLSTPPASVSPGFPLASSMISSNSTTLVTLPSPSNVPVSLSQSSQPVMGTSMPVQPSTPSPSGRSDGETVTTTTTSTVWVQPTFNTRMIAPSQLTPAPSATLLPSNVPWCITVADIAWNGQFMLVAGNPAGPDGKCSLVPTYTGLPYGSGHPSVPASSPSPAVPAPIPPSSSAAPPSSITPSSSTPRALLVLPASSVPLPAQTDFPAASRSISSVLIIPLPAPTSIPVPSSPAVLPPFKSRLDTHCDTHAKK